jgi:MFS family permease
MPRIFTMNKADIFLVFIGSLFISFAYGISFTLPLYIEFIGGNEVTIGWFFGIFGVGTIAAVASSKFLFGKMAAKKIASMGALSFAVGALGLSLLPGVGLTLFFWSFLLGTGWGFYYTSSPYLLSLFSNPKNRSTFFSYLSAFTMLGSGISPVIIKVLWKNNIQYTEMFLLIFIVALFASLIYFFICGDVEYQLPVNVDNFNSNLITHYHLYLPCLMVMLGAAIITVILHFQTIYTNQIGIDYSIFYMTYAFVVVIARFSSGKYLATWNQYALTVALLFAMTLSLIAFQFSMQDIFLYILTTTLFAVSYGLLYPTLQAIAVNLVPKKHAAEAISYFTLFYFLGLYGFPPFAGLFINHIGYLNNILIFTFLSCLELGLGLVLWKKSHFIYQLQEE